LPLASRFGASVWQRSHATTHGKDKYRRTIADVLLDGTNANHTLVKEGRCRSICPEADNLSPLKDFIKTGLWLHSSEA
jgi:endonuclease YncB( thermonuclease family)